MKLSQKLDCRAFQAVMRKGIKFMPWKEPQVLEGPGALAKLPKLVQGMDLSCVLLVTGKTVGKMKQTELMMKGLDEAGVRYVVYNEVQPNPTIENVEDAVELYKKSNCAKACGARIVNPNKRITELKGLTKVKHKLPPLIAIPTTAGTGSETTVTSVITDSSNHHKYTINDVFLIPDYAILDPKLTEGLPPHMTATTGMDALTHAVEAYIGHSNTAETCANARAAVKLIFENLYIAYKDGSDLDARANMLKASFLAGKAFTKAYVGYVHAIAHTLGGCYNIPHGYAIAVILPRMLRAYGESVYAPLSELADFAELTRTKFISKREKAERFIQEIEELNSKMGIPKTFPVIKKQDIKMMAEYADAEANPLYPVPKLMDKNELAHFIKTLME